jgi:endonuclease/exonuclease/phosphatase family metal-dependent hydrolase
LPNLRKIVRRASSAGILALAIVGSGCARALNYTDMASPRYAAQTFVDSTRVPPDTMRVVSFNVQFSKRVDIALDLLRWNDSLRNADAILLQEMDERGVRLLADSLSMNYVYYPATRHPQTGRDFGNAILSRWPLSNDRKIILPHLARYNATQRIAVAATMRMGDRDVRLYSVHLATLVNNGPTQRREQLAAVLADADSFPVALIGGDFNSETVPAIGLARNLSWPTRGLPATAALWTIDHMLLRGMTTTQLGIVRDTHGASDHRPVWANMIFAATAAATPQAVSATNP